MTDSVTTIAFGPLLKRYIEASPYDQSGFADAVKRSRSFITDIIKERRTPPLDEIETWASVLGLTGRNAQLFVDRALLAHIPPERRLRFLQILARIERLDEYQRECVRLSEELSAEQQTRIAIEKENALLRTRLAKLDE